MRTPTLEFRMLALGILFLTLEPRLSPAPLDLEFSRPSSSRQWAPTHHVSPLRFTPEGLEAVLTGDDPYLTSPRLSLGATTDLMVELRIWSEAGGKAQLFWFSDEAREEASIHFDAPAKAWVDACVALPGLSDGTRLRLDPPGTNGMMRMAWLRISPIGTRGVIRVVAQTNHLELTVEDVSGDFQVVELPPSAALDSITAGRIVHQGYGQGPTRLRLDRWVREDGHGHDRLPQGFLARQRDPLGGFRPVGSIRYVEEFRGASRYHPGVITAGSRKGLQVQMVDDAIALGVKHAALNVDLANLVDPEGASDSYLWMMDGRPYRFRKAAVEAIAAKPLSDAGAVVTLILLAYESGNPVVNRILLHPGYSRGAPNHLGGFNTATEEGAGWFAAAMGFLAERFSRPDAANGRVANFIIGNEVTAHWYWYNEGEVPPDQFVADYARTVRLANAAVQQVTDSIRVYLSFDHHWNLTYGGNPNRAIAGRQLLDTFNRVAALGGNFDWHLAYHPYPENLGNPKTWEDRTAQPGADSPRITFRNLEVLTDYLRRPGLLLRGRPRRVILSEQGFHSDGTGLGEQLQAAAYAYAWEKVATLDGIDSFIYHRHVDHQREGGLNLGLWRRKPSSVADPDVRKPIYDVFKAADTPGREEAFRFALPLVGLTNWAQLQRH